jgi:hypothetical protein
VEQGLVDGAQVLIVDPPRKGLDLIARWLANEVSPCVQGREREREGEQGGGGARRWEGGHVW